MHDREGDARLTEAGYAPQSMATRSIVTSQPDVTCDVCERRLLRGEQPEVFMAAGEPRTVCELCAPRATHEGWLREADGRSLSLPALRPRRGRNLLGRLRQGVKPVVQSPEGPVAPRERESEPYDFLEPSAADVPQGLATHAGSSSEFAAVAPASAMAPARELDGELDADDLLKGGVEGFNASEYRRRIAGVARSLGAPEVTVRPVEYLSRAVTIVVAWELCWYRYEVDLDTDGPATRLLGQGTELAELAREDRASNAVAEESGALRLSGR